MVKTYNLEELWIPEDRYLDEEYHNTPKCNIFMSPDFSEEYTGQRNENALVLIQGTGAVRAG